MNLIRLGPVILSLACTGLAYPQNNQMVKDENQPEKIRTYATKRLVTAKPVIDGKLDDACWETGEWAGNFVQWIPKEGAAPFPE